MAYTAVPTVTTGELWTAANQNTYLRDNMTALARQWIEAIGGYNTTLTADINPNYRGVVLPDANQAQAFGYGLILKSDPVAYAVVRSAGTGNFYGQFNYYAGADGEAYNNHTGGTGLGTEAVTTDENEFIQELTLSNATMGDVIRLGLERRGNNASDTINADLYVRGFYIDNS